MNLTFALSALVVGFIWGWLLRTIIVMAEISFSQERMQRKVRYWQSEAALARALARRLSRVVAGFKEGPPEWDLRNNSGDG